MQINFTGEPSVQVGRFVNQIAGLSLVLAEPIIDELHLISASAASYGPAKILAYGGEDLAERVAVFFGVELFTDGELDESGSTWRRCMVEAHPVPVEVIMVDKSTRHAK